MSSVRPDAYSYTTCIHGVNQRAGKAIIYEPAVGYDDNGVAPVDSLTYTGVHDYRLVEVAHSVFWQNRLASSTLYAGLFYGGTLSIGGGEQGLSEFDASDMPGANPMWAWTGGGSGPDAGCHFFLSSGGCWHSFAVDATDNYQPEQPSWPTIPYGALLTDPGTIGRSFFGPYDQFDQYVAYNPYLSVAPSPPAPSGLAVGLDGPDEVTQSVPSSWRALISGGTPPYQIQWTNVTSDRNPYSASGQFTAPDATFYVDVWDAVGTHVAVAKTLVVDDPTNGCGQQFIC